METENAKSAKQNMQGDLNFFEKLWDESWTYIKTVVDIVEEPVLLLDRDLRVKAANEAFYKRFQTEADETEERRVFELGDGQWNIPALKKLLEDTITQQSHFKGFEVVHEFPKIGRRVMILNARQIHLRDEDISRAFSPIVLLVIEDVTEMMAVAETLAAHTNKPDATLSGRTKKLELQLDKLSFEIRELKRISTDGRTG